MATFFTSDHHFWHQNIITYCNRPFKSVQEMNDVFLSLWNDVVMPDDVVYYLGDFSLAWRPVEYFLPRLNGRKHLIMGNHDLCHPINKKWKNYMTRYHNAGFESVFDRHILEIDENLKLQLCHFPYYMQEDIGYTEEDYKRRSVLKYNEYRPIDEGLWLLHGHVHNCWRRKERMINVGVDVWNYQPVNLEKILEIINEIRKT